MNEFKMLSVSPQLSLRRSSRVKHSTITNGSREDEGILAERNGEPDETGDNSIIGSGVNVEPIKEPLKDIIEESSNCVVVTMASNTISNPYNIGQTPTNGGAMPRERSEVMKQAVQGHGYSTRKRKPTFRYDDYDFKSYGSDVTVSSRKRLDSSTQNRVSQQMEASGGSREVVQKSTLRLEKPVKRSHTQHHLHRPVPPIGEDYDSQCTLCGKEGGELWHCAFCVKVYHKHCIQFSPYASGNPWACPKCRGIKLNYYRANFSISYLHSIFTRKDTKPVGVERKSKYSFEVAHKIVDGCAKCGLRSGEYNVAVICDCCDREFHLRCLRIHELPQGDWFCADCIDLDLCVTCVGNAKQQIEHSSAQSQNVSNNQEIQNTGDASTETVFASLNNSNTRVVQCIRCLLKFHYSCVVESCGAHFQYPRYKRALYCHARQRMLDLHALSNEDKDNEEADNALTEGETDGYNNTWLCAFCQEVNGIAKIVAQRECYSVMTNAWETQVLCKFKELSHNHLIWLATSRAKVLHPIQWKKWEVMRDMLLKGYAEYVNEEAESDELEDGLSTSIVENSEEDKVKSVELEGQHQQVKSTGAKQDCLMVSRVLDRRRCVRGSGKLKYLVKWSSLPYDEATWENAMLVAESPAVKLYLQLLEIQNSIQIPFIRKPPPSVALSSQTSTDVLLQEGYELVKGTTRIISSSYSKRFSSKQKSLGDEEGVPTTNAGLEEPHALPFDSSVQPTVEDTEENLSRLRQEFRRGKFVSYRDKPLITRGDYLYDYQLEGINWMRYSWHRRTSIILADEMGLGKTVQLINYISCLWNDYAIQGPFLIIAPLATLEGVWVREFSRWAPYINVVPYFGNPASREICRSYEFYYKHSLNSSQLMQWFSTAYKDTIVPEFNRETVRPPIPKLCNQKLFKFDVLLTSYEIFKKDCNFFQQVKWKCIVIDEGHRLKSWNSELKRTLDNFTADQRILLTGTPLQNTIDELFSLLHFLHPEKFPENRKEALFDITEEATIEVLKRELQPHVLRRIKKDVLGDKIPKKKEQIILVENSKSQKDIYRKILLKHKDAILGKTGKQIRVASLRNVVMQLRKCCNHPYLFDSCCPPCNNNEDFSEMLSSSGKLQLLHRMLTILKRNGHRVLIFSQFMRMLDIIEEYLWYCGYGYERLDGSANAMDRQQAIDRFNAQIGKKFVFLLSTRAGGIGINLTSADTVIIFDSDWNPHNDLQAQARAHRLGQKKKVAIFRLITRASVEERIVHIARSKLVLDQVVTGQVKPTEVEFILKGGALEAFSEGGEDRSIYYDDAQLEMILNRQNNETLTGKPSTESVDGEGSDEEEGQGVLDAFKVAHYETVDANQELGELDEEKNKQFWWTLLDEKDEDLQTTNNSVMRSNGVHEAAEPVKQYGRGCRRHDRDVKRTEAEVTADLEKEGITRSSDMTDTDRESEARSTYETMDEIHDGVSNGFNKLLQMVECKPVENSTKVGLTDVAIAQELQPNNEENHMTDTTAYGGSFMNVVCALNDLYRKLRGQTDVSSTQESVLNDISSHDKKTESNEKFDGEELVNGAAPNTTTPPTTSPYIFAYGTQWDMEWLCKLVRIQKTSNTCRPIIIQANEEHYLLCSVAVNASEQQELGDESMEQILAYLKPLSSNELITWKKEFNIAYPMCSDAPV